MREGRPIFEENFVVKTPIINKAENNNITLSVEIILYLPFTLNLLILNFIYYQLYIKWMKNSFFILCI